MHTYTYAGINQFGGSGIGSGSGFNSGSASGSGSIDGSGSCIEGSLRPVDIIYTTTLSPSGNGLEATVTTGIEVCLGGVFGGICDVGWDDRDARVACNQFGLTDGEL